MVAARGLPRYFVLAVAGVGCSHQLIERVSRGKSVTLAFDNDYQENEAVLRQLARLLKLRLKAGSKQEIKTSIKILV